MPGGAFFGLLFFLGLFGAAYLSDVAAFEVLIAGMVDNTRVARRRAVWMMAVIVWIVSLVPMLNLDIFVTWDLTFGSGMQALGAFLTVLTAGWCLQRGVLLEQLGEPGVTQTLLVSMLRYVIPVAMLAVGAWWLLTDVLGVMKGV